VGYDDGNTLTEKVRRKPFSIILFDEVEKAHPEVFNVLLQVLDDGHLTDSTGRKVDFKNTIIIMTSNIGVRNVKVNGRIGFTENASEERFKSMKESIEESMSAFFRPEFLNRIDDIIVFNPLQKQDLFKIIDNQLNNFKDRLNTLKIELTLSESAKTFLIDNGYDEKYGARPLKRVLQRFLEDTIAEEILKGNIKEGSSVIAELNEEGNNIIFKSQSDTTTKKRTAKPKK
jgi:ATP-dependent Clp protease ATP-binding subunit ClpC